MSKWSWKETPAGQAVQGKGFLTQILGWINSIFNEDHPWFDYGAVDNLTGSLVNQVTKSELTGAEREANAFSANEAQKQRDWEEQMSSTSYQRQVADMRAAGINPAMAMSGSGASTPSGTSASSVSPTSPGISMSDIMQLVMLPLQKKLLSSQAQLARDQGNAAMINANANMRNANTNEGNLGVNQQRVDVDQFRAETDRMRLDLERLRTDKDIQLTDAQISKIAGDLAMLKLQMEYLPKQVAIAQQNADSSTKQAAASLQNAAAAWKNALTNEKMSDSTIGLQAAQTLLTWYQSEGQKVVAENLPERTRIEIENLEKEGILLDKRGNLVDRQGRLVTAQKIKTYINCATDVFNSALGAFGGSGSAGQMSNGFVTSFMPM